MRKINEDKLKIEIEEYIKANKVAIPFEIIFNSAKLEIENNPFYNTPCEDCDNIFCDLALQENSDWKLYYCKDNR